MTPPPFGTFPKIHPFWKGKASLRMFRVGLRYREGIFASMTSVILELAVKVIMWECSFGEALM